MAEKFEFQITEKGKAIHAIEANLITGDCEVILEETVSRVEDIMSTNTGSASAQIKTNQLQLRITPSSNDNSLSNFLIEVSYPETDIKPSRTTELLAEHIRNTILEVAKEFGIPIKSEKERDYIEHNLGLEITLDGTKKMEEFSKRLTPGKSIIYWYRRKTWVRCLFEGYDIEYSNRLHLKEISTTGMQDYALDAYSSEDKLATDRPKNFIEE